MAGLVPAIHAVAPVGVGSSESGFLVRRLPHPVDGRVKPGHDDVVTGSGYVSAQPEKEFQFANLTAARALRRRQVILI
jgi:hypothetical protein